MQKIGQKGKQTEKEKIRDDNHFLGFLPFSVFSGHLPEVHTQKCSYVCHGNNKENFIILKTR